MPVVVELVEVGVGAVPGVDQARVHVDADALAAGDDSPEARRVARAAGQQPPPQVYRRAPLRDDGQPGLDARLPLVYVHARQVHPAPVREARRVDHHVGVVAEAPEHEARIGLLEGERRLARAHLLQELARPLAVEPRPRPQKARHARAPPLLGVAVRQARAHVERDHRVQGVAVGPRHLVDHVPEPRLVHQLVEDPGVAEGEGARAGPPAVLGRVRLEPVRHAPVLAGGDVEGEVPPLAAAEHAPVAVDDTPEVGVVVMGPPPVPPRHRRRRILPPALLRDREVRSRPRAQR